MLYSFYKNIYIFLLFLLNITNELKYKTKKLIFEYLFIHNYIFFYILSQKNITEVLFQRNKTNVRIHIFKVNEINFYKNKIIYMIRKNILFLYFYIS